MNSFNNKIFCITILFITITQLCNVLAVGGMAEMKALTGDAPYLGTGNHEQAPDYFGSSLYRNYYGGYNGDYPGYNSYRNRYQYNNYNTEMGINNIYGSGYNLPYRNYLSGSVYGPRATSTYTNTYTPIISGGNPSSLSNSGGFYQGEGNDWVLK